MPTSPEIAQRIVEAILAERLAPGSRLGEQALADLFQVSRTLVREALMRLAARGIVMVSARRGWYVLEPSAAEAREAFQARQVIETGLIRQMKALSPEGLKRLRGHIFREKQAIKSDDVGSRTYLLGDFHVCLAETLGNTLLAETLRDLAARTTLISMLSQSTPQAEQSCREHEEIVAALAKGDRAKAERIMRDHIAAVESEIDVSAAPDPLESLRAALVPVAASHEPSAPGKRPRGRPKRRAASSNAKALETRS